MSNILIIKHGSLGDIAQASGAIQDISENHKNSQIHILTTKPYIDLFKKNPFINNVILDKRYSRFNLIYLYLLMKNLSKYKFIKVFDLQNSSRTSFYKKILFPKASSEIWSSSITTLPEESKKDEFDKKPVLDRFNYQLEKSNIKTNFTMKPNFSWACINIDEIKKKFDLNKYIVLFPFCSPHLSIKKWPYYNELIGMIKNHYKDKYKLVIAPGPLELNMTKEIDAIPILDNGKILNIFQLASLIKDSSYVVANDTGPSHMAAHLNSKGLTLFGKHTTAYKVSIERENYKAIQVENLNNLSAEKVFKRLNNFLN
tara:strand:+ start:691 stop:1632 length:942 start_codon:yes stop_codon:yes gene_type:complete